LHLCSSFKHSGNMLKYIMQFSCQKSVKKLGVPGGNGYNQRWTGILK
jgi:hypothetical protein